MGTFSLFRDLFCGGGPLLPHALPDSAQYFVFDDRSHGSEEPSSNQKLQVEFSDIPGSFESNRPFIFYLFVSVVLIKSQIDLLSIESRSRPFLY